VALIKFANMSLHVKMHQEKKTAIKKNSTVIDRESDSLSITVEFLIGFFFLGALFTCKLQVPTSTIQFLW
jgi:hypothetical protein